MAITVVNITKSNSLTPTIPSTTAGNCLLVLIASKGSSGSAASVSGITLGGAAGNFASLAAAHGTDGFSDWADAFAWADPSCAGGQTAIVISGSNLGVASGSGGVTILEIQQIAASSPLDKSSTGNGISSSFASGSTAATTVAAELWAAIAATPGSASGPGSPWTDESPAGGAAAAAYQIVSSTGAASYSGNCNDEAWAALVVTLKQGSTLVSGWDTGSGADSSSIAVALPATADTGSGADAGVIDQPGTETGTGAETSTLTASVPGAVLTSAPAFPGQMWPGSIWPGNPVTATTTPGGDTGSGAETATVGVAGSDTGTGADAGSQTFGALGLDTGTAAESGAILAATIAGSDTGSGAETSSIAATLPTTADTGSGADVAKVGVSSADTGAGAESATQAPYVPPPIVLWKAGDKLSMRGGTMR